MTRCDEDAKASPKPVRAVTTPPQTAALWSALRQERRAVDERASLGAARCGWLPASGR